VTGWDAAEAQREAARPLRTAAPDRGTAVLLLLLLLLLRVLMEQLVLL